MNIEMSYRPKTVLHHRKTFSNCLKETQFNHRNYLILLSHFSDNLNTSIRNLEDCISDLEQHPMFKISRSQRQFIECGLQYLYDLYLDRVCKESYYRNAVIRNNYNCFLQNYSVFFRKNTRQQYQKTKVFSVKSYSQKLRKSQRSVFNKQTLQKINIFSERRQVKNSMLLSRSVVYKPKISTSLEKHNIQDSNIFTVKKASIVSKYSRKITISPSEQGKNSDCDIRGGLLFINYSKLKNQQFDYDLQKSKKPVQSLSTNRVLAFRNRIATNPEQNEKQKSAKYGRMLRMSYTSIQGNRGCGKSKLPYQQQIKLILNMDN